MDYYHIRKVIDKRIYEIARKYSCDQYKCKISFKIIFKIGEAVNKAEIKQL